MKMSTFPEMMHQVDDAKLRQQVDNKLADWFLGLIQVHIEISQQDGVFNPEALQGLLKIREVGQRGQWDVCSNYQGPGRASANLTDYHVRPMKAHQLKDPSCQPVPQNQAHASLRSAGAIGPVRQTENIAVKPIPEIRCHGDLCFGDDHGVKST